MTESFAEADELSTDSNELLSANHTERNNPLLADVFVRSIERKIDQTDQVSNGLYETATSALGKLAKMQDRVRKLEEKSSQSGNRNYSPDHLLTNDEFLDDLQDFYNIADCALGFFADEILSLQQKVENDRKEAVAKKKFIDNLLTETIREYEAAQHDMRGDGTLIWCVRRFGELVRDTQQTSRYSKRFQTPEGFEFRLRMFPNGAGKGKNSHISVFVQMCRTETDPMLPYPFQGLCIVTLYDQNTSRGKKEHYTVKFKTNSSSCFQRPTSEFNPENGVAQFVSHDLLRAHTNNSDTKGDKPVYMHNNTIFIGAEIRYTNNLLKLFNSPGKNNVGDKDSGNSRKSNSSAGGNGREESNSSVGSSISHSSGNESSTSELGGNMTTATEDHSAMDTA